MKQRAVRTDIWNDLTSQQWDIIVVGGGITGAGIAREAARRGFKTALVEQRDYAWGTSSRSSKMVHGGLRYIAQGDIRLTWHSLTERERLLIEAPGLVSRLGYWYAHFKGHFPGPFVFGILLKFYDFLARVKLSRYVSREAFLKVFPNYEAQALQGGSWYTDAVVDDSRLVMRVLDEAKADGAVALNYAKVTDLHHDNNMLDGVTLLDVQTGKTAFIKSKIVVNATGAWADVLRSPIVHEKKVRPQRGSHLVLAANKLPLQEAVIFMHPDDKRAMFVYPWEGRTVIGTTDLDHQTDLNEEAKMSRDELVYMLKGVNAQFPQEELTDQDVIASFSGVRPIIASGKGANPSAERRDHSVWDDQGLITATGGKLTTFRLMAIDVLKAAQKYFPNKKIIDDKGAVFRQNFTLSNDFEKKRLQGRFGFLTEQFLAEMSKDEQISIEDLATEIAELRWALRYEQVEHLDDLLLRRTRLGLLLPQGASALFSKIKEMCAEELAWTDTQWQEEIERYKKLWQTYYYLP